MLGRSGDAYLCTREDGVLVQCNPAAEEVFGRSRDHILGRHVAEVLAGGSDPETHARIVTAAETATGEVLELQVAGVGESAARIAVWRAEHRGEALVHWLRREGPENTDRNAAVARSATAEARFAAVFEHSPLGILLWRPGSELFLANSVAGKILGRRAADLLNARIADIAAPEDAVSLERLLAGVIGGRSDSIEHSFRALRPDGDVVRLRARSTLVRGDEQHVVIQIEGDAADAPAEAVLAEREHRDALTGLCNRARFGQIVDGALEIDPSDDVRLGILLLDLDGFRDVNDGLGQRAGDLVLQETARRLESGLRRTDVVARFGNDEFAILLRDVGAAEDAIAITAVVREALEPPFDIDGVLVHISASIGIAVAPDDSPSRSSLIQRANVALARARSLRSGWAVYQPDADDFALDRLALAADLRAAIEREELDVAYQPIIETRSGRVVALEALARWQHAERGFVPPDQFIVIAEQMDLIAPLTRLVLGKAAAACAKWRSAGHDVRVAVNLSIHVLGNTDFEAVLVEELSRAGLEARHLVLEVTESALAEDVKQLERALGALRELGVHLVIDDFGTGYSAMSYLKQLPLEELKIDRSFVQEIATDPRDLSIVRSLVRLAHSLGLRVVAEGVETAEARDILDSMGCDFAQGYGIARPMPEDDVAGWLVAAAPAETPIVEASVVADRSSGPCDVLIVEDSETVRRLLAGRARAAGWTVREAGSGEEALTAIATAVPDVVVLDHQLPGISGVQAIPGLRDAGLDGPILLFTRFLTEAIPQMRVPLDVWPVSKNDPDAVLELLDAYRANAATG